MRLKLTLEKTSQASVLPINYSYPFSSWIYRIVAQADESYADFLHNEGYTLGLKRFKLFTFSNLYIPKRYIIADRIEILCPQISLIVCFYLDQASETFVEGLFVNEHFTIGDHHSQVGFKVVEIERLPELVTNDHSNTDYQRICFHTLSPIVVSTKNDQGLDHYLSPLEQSYETLLIGNLLDKYQSVGGAFQPDWADAPMSFRLLSKNPKSRLVTLKDQTRQQTKVRGYLYDFELTAPLPILRIGLLGGFGRYNAGGFGCCEQLRTEPLRTGQLRI